MPKTSPPAVRRVQRSLAGIVLLGVLLWSAGTAFAETPAATVERGTITTPFSESADVCGVPATIVGEDILRYQSVQTDQGFHFVGTDQATFVLTAADGTYAIGGSTDHFEFNAVAGEVHTDAHHDWMSFYTADGQFLFEGQFRKIEHYTVTPDGTLRVDFERIVVDTFPPC
jgi:hypothetical protein